MPVDQIINRHFNAKFDETKYFADLKAENPFDRDFKPIRVLGEGAFGKVLLCRSNHNEIERAIKVMKRSDINGKKSEREIDILKQLNHPNLIRYCGSYEHKGKVYLVTEYCNGKEFLAEIVQGGRLTEKQAQKYFREITEALVYLHSKNIVHRDLKPDNIIIEKETKLVKIIDFGLSEKIEKQKEKINSDIGVSMYSAPEVDKGHYNHKCDIWSMGIILYLTLCGQVPFKASTFKELTKEKGSSVKFKGYKWDRVSHNAKDFITKCLYKHHKDRMSALDALNHAWLHQEASDEVILDKSLVGQLYAYSKECILVNNIKYFICALNKFQRKEKELVEVFKRIDVNKNGEISKEEMIRAYDDNTEVFESFNIDRSKVGLLFDKMDLDGSGSLDFLEFIVAIKNIATEITRNSLKTAFRRLSNEEGYLDIKSLSLALGTKLPEYEWVLVTRKYDKDGNGKIDFEEFTNIFKV